MYTYIYIYIYTHTQRAAATRRSGSGTAPGDLVRRAPPRRRLLLLLLVLLLLLLLLLVLLLLLLLLLLLSILLLLLLSSLLLVVVLHARRNSSLRHVVELLFLLAGGPTYVAVGLLEGIAGSATGGAGVVLQGLAPARPQPDLRAKHPWLKRQIRFWQAGAAEGPEFLHGCHRLTQPSSARPRGHAAPGPHRFLLGICFSQSAISFST